ncbi:hypothetical protein Droror1_Dr00010457 [Drosera rotundifolia]
MYSHIMISNTNGLPSQKLRPASRSSTQLLQQQTKSQTTQHSNHEPNLKPQQANTNSFELAPHYEQQRPKCQKSNEQPHRTNTNENKFQTTAAPTPRSFNHAFPQISKVSAIRVTLLPTPPLALDPLSGAVRETHRTRPDTTSTARTRQDQPLLHNSAGVMVLGVLEGSAARRRRG